MGEVLAGWAKRPAAVNDALLRNAFQRVLRESEGLPPEQRLIMYDAVDENEVRAPLGAHFRKRLDARRNTKPKKSDDQVLVCTPFDPAKFNFGKIRDDRERLAKLQLDAGRYDILTNKFPLFPKHMLLVAGALVPQQMNADHLSAIAELLQATNGFCAYFNSWCASASVNHFHLHLIDEFPPVTSFPLVAGPTVGGVRCLTPQGFPGFCFVLPISAVGLVGMLVREMQADNQPHNLLFTPRLVYLFPKPHLRPTRSFDLYPETVGGPELIGSFTVYTPPDYAALTEESVAALCRMNTAPLPSRLLQVGRLGAVDFMSGVAAVDDDAVLSTSTTDRAISRQPIAASSTAETLPALPALLPQLHSQSWPQDRPIARALANNIAFV